MLSLAVFLAMVASFVQLPQAWAVARTIPPTPFEGTITQIVQGPSGKPDGLVLGDHTLLEFPAASLANSSSLTIGDHVSGTGIQVLSAPNRVFDRVALNKGTQRLFDNSKMQYPPAPPIPSGTQNQKLRSMAETSPLVAVGANPDGQIDRLILANGRNALYVQIPQGAYVNPLSVQLGQPVAVQGAGMQLQGGDLFIHAFTAQTVGGPWLLQARGYDGEQWMLKEGSIKQALATPQGKVDGVLLTDNTSIFFTPVPGGQVSGLLPGVLVRAAGPGVGNRMSADSLLLSRQNEFISLVPPVTGAGMRAGQMAGQVAGAQIPPAEMIPMKDTSRVEAMFKNDAGQVVTLVLADRTRVQIPPRLRPFLPASLGVGKTVFVSGRGGTYMMGTAIEADRINLKTGLAG